MRWFADLMARFNTTATDRSFSIQIGFSLSFPIWKGAAPMPNVRRARLQNGKAAGTGITDGFAEALSNWCNKGSLAPSVSVDARKQETPSPTTGLVAPPSTLSSGTE